MLRGGKANHRLGAWTRTGDKEWTVWLATSTGSIPNSLGFIRKDFYSTSTLCILCMQHLMLYLQAFEKTILKNQPVVAFKP